MFGPMLNNANLAAVARVFLSAINSNHYIAWLVLAAIFWSMAFAVFVMYYARVLIRPRIDGRPG